MSGNEAKNGQLENINKRKPYQKKRVIVPIITAIIFLAFGVYSLINSYYYQSTDDAYIEGQLISVAPRVSGPVVKLFVDDNQEVKKGQLLFEIDSQDYTVKYHQAKAKLKEEEANLKVAKQTILQYETTVNEAIQNKTSLDTKLNFAQSEYDRYSKMYKIGVSSKQEYEKSLTNLTVYQAKQKAVNERVKQAQINLKIAEAKKEVVEANILKAQAELEQAALNFSYTKVFAPQTGTISSKNIETGNYIKTAQPVMKIVSPKMWVVANFKETQLTHMDKNQPVSIKIDTYPDKMFEGRIDSIQSSSGAKSSLFPPENAVGSYVKIVQRIPVKIVFTENFSDYKISPGMSVVPRVKIR